MNTTSINLPDNSGSFAIMLRHAERFPIHNMADALNLPLTSKGKNDAYLLGQNLARYSPFTIYHSPVPRCRETADSIREGILSVNQQATLEGLVLDLGGPYITGNWEAIVSSIEQMGHAGFVRKWFDNELPSNLIMSLPKAAHIQLMILVNQLRSHKTSTINVTHDWNIMIMREYYFKFRHEEIGDPDYLDGVYAFFNNGKLHIGYHEHVRTITLPDN